MDNSARQCVLIDSLAGTRAKWIVALSIHICPGCT
ncbi:hypothetical protein MT3952 [Mycobacterium tuberculosis CDC1551]|uniref:Uncharacterized protein n=1 Tax=Mycobacterium tuberculosis (strain CDC 1551 / Oshkosh) TaxID=83331 RepID=Q8VIT0_MYCTO|nr:hypothetical protein MT3952 [Mycobacterium tuberculosis CDC1551]